MKFRIVPPNMHGRFCIGLPKMHGRFHIGLPTIHGQFFIGLPKMHGRYRIGPPEYLSYYERKATQTLLLIECIIYTDWRFARTAHKCIGVYFTRSCISNGMG